MLYRNKMPFHGCVSTLLLWLGLFFSTPVQGQVNGIPTKFDSFKDYYLFTSKPDSMEKFVYAHRNNPKQFLNELLWLEFSRYTTSDHFGRDMATIRNLLVQQKSALATAVYHTIKARSLRNVSFLKARIHLRKAEAYFKRSNDTSGIIYAECQHTYMNMSIDSQTKDGLKLAKTHFDRAMKLIEASSYAGDKLELLKIMDYKPQFVEYPEVEVRKDFNKLLQIIQENPQFSFKLVTLYNHYSIFLSSFSKHKEALKYALLSLSGYSGSSEYRKIPSYEAVAREYVFLNELEKAEYYFSKIIAANDPTRRNFTWSVAQSYEALIYIDLRLKRFDRVEKSMKARDSIIYLEYKNEEAIRVWEQQKKYESEKKELRIEKLALENQKEKSDKQNLLWAFLVTSGLVSLSVVLLIKLRRSNADLLKLQTGRDKFYTIIAHDLRSPMNNLNDLGILLPRLLKEGSKQEIDALGAQIEKTATKTTLLLDNLLEWGENNYFNRTTIEAEQEMDIVPILEASFNALEPFAEIKKVALERAFPSSQWLSITPQPFGLVVRNLLDNALKNTPTGGKIIMEVSKTNDQTPSPYLSITDTGKGISPEKLYYLQQVFSGKIKPEVGIDGLGLGMVLVHDYAMRSNVAVSIESKLGKGTCFRLTWPASKLVSDRPKVSTQEESINYSLG